FQCSMLSAQLSYANSNLNLLKIATEAQTRGLEKDPYWPLNWANLGMLVWGEGNHEEAISYMQAAVDKAPRSSLFALNLGWMAEQNGQTDLALRTYIAALENEPWLQVSPFFTQTGVRTSALRSAALDESLVPVGKLNLQGYRAYKAGQLELAASHLTSAIQADPSNGETLALLALLAQKRGRLEEAWLSAQTAAFVDRDSPRVLTWAAHVALEQGRVPDAVGYIERALENWKLYKELYNSEYFYFVYHRMTLQENLVPGYQRADVTDEMVASYLWLAWYYESNHMTLAAKDMLRLLEISGLH
ncbi:MAG: tetratricopeptide repeat protein, partial [Gammaproteobacteria bacterium]